MTEIPVFCGKDCGGDACPLLATVIDGRVTRVSNNPAGGKYLKGCARGFNLPLEHYAPDRILQPLVRSGPRGSLPLRSALEWMPGAGGHTLGSLARAASAGSRPAMLSGVPSSADSSRGR